MNKRIKELAEQCRGNPMTSAFEPYFDKEKFAELIVRECACIAYDASYYECALNVSNEIKEYFGVEE